MLRRLLESPKTYFILAAVLVIAALASTIRIQLPPREPGGVEDIRSLRERDDLNVVFILIDTLRADHLSSYGYHRKTSPVMDEIARYGVRFSQVVSQSSWTKSSMASLWTARHPAYSGVLRFPHALSEDTAMPAEVLKERGYYTAGLFRNGWVDPIFGFGQGFDVYLHPRVNENLLDYKRRQLSGKVAGSDLDVTQAGTEFLRQFKHRRFLLYLHYMDVHQYAYDESSALFGTRYVDYYDNAIHWVDSNVGTVVQELIDLELLDDTVLVIASDHGEEFRDHGREGHARTLYREVVHTPLIFSFPFRLEEGVVVDALVENVDIWPTLYDLLGIETPESFMGESLVPHMLGESDASAEARAISELDRTWGRAEEEPRPSVAVTTDRWKLVHDLKSERSELYDRIEDPTEQRNVAGSETEAREALEEIVARHVSGAREDGHALQPVEKEIDELRLNQLRAIGYAVGGGPGDERQPDNRGSAGDATDAAQAEGDQ